MAYAGVKFIEKEHADSLFKHGFCAIAVSKKDREANHPDIGDTVDFLLGESTQDWRCSARLVADQEVPDGSLVSIYMAAASRFKRDG